ncbi:MAG: sulfite exporter TauE/SafE family protein [Patescibacteria group bacterium]
MTNTQPYILKFHVQGVSEAKKEEFSSLVRKQIPDILQIDLNLEKSLGRIVSNEPLPFSSLTRALQGTHFSVSPVSTDKQNMTVHIQGMHCRSCEITIERKFKTLSGVEVVNVNAANGKAKITYSGSAPSSTELGRLIAEDGYTIQTGSPQTSFNPTQQRLPAAKLVGLFALVLVLGYILLKAGVLSPSVDLGGSTGYGAAFVLGLIAATSSCLAVSGGLLLSTAARFNERYASATPAARMRPVGLFVLGRVASYGVLGGAIGLVGQALEPSPWVTGGITIVAAVYMFIMGLDMLHLAPPWMKQLMPRMPKSLSHKIMDGEKTTHPLAPFSLGALTFFLPCGFTQALQLYALTTGSAVTSGLILFLFALGTAPALLALGWASGALKGKWGQRFFQFSGALVVVLGIWNAQNGLAITGHPLRWPSLSSSSTLAASDSTSPDDPNVAYDGTKQVVRMKASPAFGYDPEQFTLRAGVPTEWIVDGTEAGGCISVLQAPQLGIREYLDTSTTENVITFTPQKPGTFTFSCSMGMYVGQIKVVADTN